MSNPAVTANQLRDRLLALAQEPDSYPFINAFGDYLALMPHDAQMRAVAVKVLAKKGLVSVAAQVARACPADVPQCAEIRGVGDQLSRVASEIMDWSTTDARFEANLRSLRNPGGRAVELADTLERVWRETVPKLTLHQANDGNVQVSAIASDGRRLWVPMALDFAGAAEVVPDRAEMKGRIVAPVLLDGVGSGLLVPRLYEATQCTFLMYSPAFYVCEECLPALALAMRLHDWRGPLSDERVFLFAGPSAWDQWRELVLGDDRLPLPQHVYALPRWPGQQASKCEPTHREVVRHFQAVRDQWLDRANSVYAGRDAAYWAHRYVSAGPDNPLRALCLTSRFSTFVQYSMRDACAALERQGVVAKLMIEEKDYSLFGQHAYLRAIAEFQPDLILLIDHHRHEYPDRLIEHVPFVCWIQDELPNLYNTEAGRRMGPLDFTMGFGKGKCVLNFGYPADRFMPCNMAVDPAKFMRSSGTDEDDGALRCDVAYVSHHSEAPAQLHARLRGLAGDAPTRRLMDTFYEDTRELFASSRFTGAYDLNRLLDQVTQKVGAVGANPADRERMLGMFVRPLADRTLRHTTLEWVANWADATGRVFHIYGNGWDQHPRFARYAKGPAKHGEHLARIVRAAGIHLHAGINPALHQRVLETVCAGGFLLVRYNPNDFFPPKHDHLVDYVLAKGGNELTQIPVGEIPDDAVCALRDYVEATGGELPERIDIPSKLVMELKVQRGVDKRYLRAGSAFPRLTEITFNSGETFAERAEWFLAHADERRAVNQSMQSAITELFTYDALMARLLAFIGHVLRSSR